MYGWAESLESFNQKENCYDLKPDKLCIFILTLWTHFDKVAILWTILIQLLLQSFIFQGPIRTQLLLNKYRTQIS